MFGKAKQKAKEAAELAKAKANEVDEKYKVSEKAAAGAGMAAAGAGQMAAAGAQRAKEAREVAAAKAKELGEAAEDALGKAPSGPSLGTVIIAAPRGSERDALTRMFRAVPGGHFDVVDCASMEEAKEELKIRGPGSGHPLRAVIVRGDLPARSKASAPAGVAAVVGGGVVFNFDSPAPVQDALPAGWEIRESTQYFLEDGVTPRKFFFNTQTNETSWERPKPPAVAAGDDGSDDGSAVALLEWFRQLMIGQTAEIPCVLAVAAVNIPLLKQRAGLRVAKAKNFASFEQFNADMTTKTEEEKQALVAELNATLQEELNAAKQLRDAQAAKAKEAGVVALWPVPTKKEAVDQLAKHCINIEQRRQRIARQAFGTTVPLKIWACTFNIACERHPFELGAGGNVEAMLSTFVPKDHDVYVVGVQEAMGDGFFQGMAEYLDSFGVQLITGHASGQGKGFGPRIEGRGDGSLMTTKYTGIAAFAKKTLVVDGHVKVKRECVHEFKGEEGKIVKDMKESLGSKGGAALAIQCFDTTLAVISVHMAKEWHKVAKKRAQYRELSAQLGRKLGDANFDLHSQFHHAIWMGDFNYHIGSELDPDQCMKAIAATESTWDRLGKYDEMRKEMEGGHVYVGFSEPDKALDFHPSYKKKVPRAKSAYTTGETWVAACYDINFKQQWYKGGKVKLRMPSWTDRILYASLVATEGSSASRLEPLMEPLMGQPLYQAANDVLLCSDHSAVHASFALTALNQRLEPKEDRQFRYKVEIVEVTLVHPGGTPPVQLTAEKQPAASEQTAASALETAEGGAAPPPADLLSMTASAPAPAPVVATEPAEECEEIPDRVLALVPAPWEGVPDRKPECKNAPAPVASSQGQQQGDLLALGFNATPAAPGLDLLSMPEPAAPPSTTQPEVDLLSMGAPEPAADTVSSGADAADAGGHNLLGLARVSTGAAVGGETVAASSGLSSDDARNNIFRFVGGDVGSASTEHHICLKVMRKKVHPLTGEETYEAAEAAFAIKLPVAPPAGGTQQVDLLGGAATGPPEPVRETMSSVLLASGMPWFGGKGGGPTSVRVVVETSLEPIGEGM